MARKAVPPPALPSNPLSAVHMRNAQAFYSLYARVRVVYVCFTECRRCAQLIVDDRVRVLTSAAPKSGAGSAVVPAPVAVPTTTALSAKLLKLFGKNELARKARVCLQWMRLG
jgi:hypothetical protein